MTTTVTVLSDTRVSVDVASGSRDALLLRGKPLGVLTPTVGQTIVWNGTAFVAGDAGGAGTVASVALSAPGIFSVTGSPVTSTGTLALALTTQSANRVWAGPGSGSAAAPTFRSLVAADLPDLSSVYVTPSSLSTSLSAYLNAAAIAAAYQPLDADLTAIAALTGTGGWAKRTAANTWALSTPSASDVGLGSVENAAASGLYVPLTRTVNGQALSGNVSITSITGNAGSATVLQTARNINGVSFDGSGNITVTADPNAAIDLAATGAGGVTGILPAARGGTGVSNSGTITLGNNLITSGNYALTLTQTGTTNVTLPTTGMLATTTHLASYLPLAGGTLTGALALAPFGDLALWELYSSGGANRSGLRITTPSGGPITFASEAAGTGTARDIRFQVANVYCAGSLQTNAMIAIAYQTANGALTFPINGALRITDNTGNDFNRIQFGRTDNLAPAIKRSSAKLQVRLADDSAFADQESLYRRSGSGSPESVVTAPVGAIYHRTDGGSGTSIYVKESGAGSIGWTAK